jgi:hypothetical protein
MNKHSRTVIVVFICILLIAVMFQNVRLMKRLDKLEDNLAGNLAVQVSDIRNNMSLYYSTIMDEREEQDSVLSDYAFSFESYDIAARTATLYCELTPKSYSSPDPSAKLKIGGADYPMTFGDGVFTVRITMPLFEDTHVDSVTLTDGETVSNEEINWNGSAREEFLPKIDANLSGSGRGSIEDGFVNWHRTGYVDITITGPVPADIVSLSIFSTVDGEETSRTEIDMETAAQVLDRPGESTVPSVRAPGNYEKGTYYFFNYRLDAEYEIPFGSTFELYAEAVDSHGLRYRRILEQHITDENGKFDTNGGYDWVMAQVYEAEIYDGEGNALYRIR